MSKSSARKEQALSSAAQPVVSAARPKVYLSVRQTAEKLNCHEITIWKWIKRVPDFPKRVRVSPGRVAFIEHEIDEYLASRPRA